MIQRLPSERGRGPLDFLPVAALAAVIAGCGGDGGGGGRSAPTALPEPPPAIRIASASVGETDEGTVDALFRVSLSGPPRETATVAWRTRDGTASAGDDYRSGSGTLVFDPAVTEEVIAVEVIGDSRDESDEEFEVVLSDPVGATVEEARATGRIEDDDAVPIVDSSKGSGPKGKARKKREGPSASEGDD